MDDERTDVDVDETDLALLRRVERDDDVNLTELAAELDLSKSAVHYRLNKLKDAGVITAVSADVDPLALGLTTLVITEVSVVHESGYADEIGTELTEIDGTVQVYYTMGDVDFVVLSRVQNREQLNALIDEIVSIDGVNETSSTFVMKELKTGGETVAAMSDEMIANLIEE
ncbi:Lrp/AsnC family transcriptional regulator [Natrarchaeobaculum sulfurireducens]|uniref:DNA-binding transcriptional regulator, Lrp family n=1 Tax=Natrarchaeobaculum sulfurireducens TaxID=2044521 RepID=A0A346PT70_9EURY|nr:Lrp/AsnC family transcriptional regulator [Natrarchaeobaculum sulfurireducens]AXR77322.1 DNA-binding transcriptional regulator, Lrp family [Natrarchaeobaculum sulfurireducens]AXR82715.1 Transcriptional regulator, AsnC family [Natrarchaeobaculum sulfurireducens]